jgi:hypothetical protein
VQQDLTHGHGSATAFVVASSVIGIVFGLLLFQRIKSIK